MDGGGILPPLGFSFYPRDIFKDFCKKLQRIIIDIDFCHLRPIIIRVFFAIDFKSKTIDFEQADKTRIFKTCRPIIDNCRSLLWWSTARGQNRKNRAHRIFTCKLEATFISHCRLTPTSPFTRRQSESIHTTSVVTPASTERAHGGHLFKDLMSASQSLSYCSFHTLTHTGFAEQELTVASCSFLIFSFLLLFFSLRVNFQRTHSFGNLHNFT